MSLKFNSGSVTAMRYNGLNVVEAKINGVIVFPDTPNYDYSYIITVVDLTYSLACLYEAGLIVNWGDGSADTVDITSHTYSTAGTYTIQLKGTITYLFSFSIRLGASLTWSIPSCLYSGNLVIDWGDETSTTNTTSHTYESFGSYAITTKGNITDLSFFTGDMDTTLTTFNAPLPPSMSSKTDFTYFCAGAASLTSIPNNLFENCSSATNMSGAFAACIILNTIPSNLFASCAALINVISCFEGCAGLLSIPSSLFSHNNLISNFNYVFSSTSITSIPFGLFANCVNAESFNGAFWSVTSITNIPSGLFSNCNAVTDFSYVFWECTNLNSIPNNLFNAFVNVTTFDFCFSRCPNIISIPPELFINCTSVNTIAWCFEGDTGLTGDAPALWEQYPSADGTMCFAECNGLSNYFSIPMNWRI